MQGYHPYAEDAEIYLPGVEHLLDPKLFPVGREYFLAHARMTLFPNLLASFLRITHVPMEAGLFLWQVAAIYLLLLASWQLSGLFFARARSRWSGVCLIAALLTIPVAGTALYVMDQYLNPRNLAAFAGIFSVTRLLEKKYLWALLWLAFAAAMHPLMWIFPFSFCLLLVVMDRVESWWSMANEAPTQALICTIAVPVVSPAYHQAALKHGFHYIQHWAWYELLGIAAPLLLFWWFARIARDRGFRNVERVSRAMVVYGFIYVALALAFDLPASFEALARLQPLRSLHFLYIVMFVMMGGFLGEFVLKDRIWRRLLLFVPLSAGMLAAQLSLFPASAHVELPGMAPRNPWGQAFLWIRRNTPEDAVFAIDPNAMTIRGEDEIGFRCMAERSRLADAVKDNGVVSMFPPMADVWWAQVEDQSPWKNLGSKDFRRLKDKYGVGWLVLEEPAGAGFDCVYHNGTVTVCRVP